MYIVSGIFKSSLYVYSFPEYSKSGPGWCGDGSSDTICMCPQNIHGYTYVQRTRIVVTGYYIIGNKGKRGV